MCRLSDELLTQVWAFTACARWNALKWLIKALRHLQSCRRRQGFFCSVAFLKKKKRIKLWCQLQLQRYRTVICCCHARAGLHKQRLVGLWGNMCGHIWVQFQEYAQKLCMCTEECARSFNSTTFASQIGIVWFSAVWYRADSRLDWAIFTTTPSPPRSLHKPFSDFD